MGLVQRWEPRLERENLSWKGTFARLRADRERISQFLTSLGPEYSLALRLRPSYLCVFLHRISHHFYRGGHRYVARLFWHLNIIFTGADISEPNDIGGGVLIVCPPGTAIMAKAGRNLTVMPGAGIGSELGRWNDIGAGPGLPVLGDDVVLEPHGAVLGPVHIGNRVRVGAGFVVTVDVPDDTFVEGYRPRTIMRSDL